MGADPRWKHYLRTACYAALDLLTLGRGVPVRLGGEVFRLTPRWSRAFRADYEREGLQTVARSLLPGELVVDVGAHVGVYCLTMARAVGPTGRVVAFEPNPPAAEALRRHIALNHAQKWVEVRQAALGSARGTAMLHTQEGAAAPGSSLYPQSSTSHRVEVEVATLDDLFPDDEPRLIKLDVEGFERQVLMGGKRLLARASGLVILCEVHVDNMPLLGETPEQLHDLLTGLGYAAFTLDGTLVSGFAASGQYLFRRRQG